MVLDRDEDVENAITGDWREQAAAGWWGTIETPPAPAPVREREGLLLWNGMQNKNCIELRSFLAWCILGKEGFLFFPWDIQKFKIKAFHWGEQHGRAAQAGAQNAVNFALIFFLPIWQSLGKKKNLDIFVSLFACLLNMSGKRRDYNTIPACSRHIFAIQTGFPLLMQAISPSYCYKCSKPHLF